MRQERRSLGSEGGEIANPAKVQDLIDALDIQGDRAASYLDIDTGEVHVIAHEALELAEEGAGAHRLEWEEEEVALAQRILAGGRHVELPTSRDVHEWRIMEAFCYSLGDEDIQADCLSAIRGRGAFRVFRNELSRHGLWDAWHAFRGAARRCARSRSRGARSMGSPSRREPCYSSRNTKQQRSRFLATSG